MMLTLLEQGRPEVRGVAEALLGLEVWVGWPHLVEAKVVAVQSGKLYIDQSGEREVRDMVTQGQNFEKLGQTIKQQYSSRRQLKCSAAPSSHLWWISATHRGL